MNLEISTPALLFSTVSLLILAFNNRFISITQLIRELIKTFKSNGEAELLPQIEKLKLRILIIRNMQIVAVSSLLLSVVTMFLLFYNLNASARITFAIALAFLVIAMALSIYELMLSTNALKHLYKDLDSKLKEGQEKDILFKKS